MIVLPKLSLYIHIPWCVQKCPYCDFNSHALKPGVSYQDYIDHLLRDLEQDLPLTQGRSLHSIFIGGGTPSLLSAPLISQLLDGIRQRIAIDAQAEITLEANPGTVDMRHFSAYYNAGITRISLGIQSFNDQKLISLGRIHNSAEAKHAVQLTQSLPFQKINLDLMHGLPNQTVEEALSDLRCAIALAPTHLSWYQLTLEPHTLFASRPPKLPNDEVLWQIYQQGDRLLTEAGYQQYETSAYAKPGYQCQHNLNYWRFGDYLGIGCGAHGKLSYHDGKIIRTSKTRHPQGYMQGHYVHQHHDVALADRPFEFFMNRFRLHEPTPKQAFVERTFQPLSLVDKPINSAKKAGYLLETDDAWQVTEHGKLFLNSLLELFL